MNSDNNILQTPREHELIKAMEQLEELVSMASQKIATLEQSLKARESELTDLRRTKAELQSENQRQKDVMHTWRQRINSVLGQLNEFG